jgi:hypothetical protein
MLSANSLHFSAAHYLCQNVSTISCEEKDENQREPSPGYMVGDLFVAAAVCAQTLS